MSAPQPPEPPPDRRPDAHMRFDRDDQPIEFESATTVDTCTKSLRHAVEDRSAPESRATVAAPLNPLHHRGRGRLDDNDVLFAIGDSPAYSRVRR